MVKYSFAEKNLSNYTTKYHYSPFYGQEFLVSWENHRSKYIDISKSYSTETVLALLAGYKGKTDSQTNILKLIFRLNGGLQGNLAIGNEIDLWVKRFETKKKIYDNYKTIQHTTEADGNIVNYLTLSFLLLLAFKNFEKLQYLNCFLKINDLLCSEIQKFDEKKSVILSYLLQNEVCEIRKKAKDLNIKW